MNRGMIDTIMSVSSKHKYVVYGSVRGLVSEHRTFERAEANAERDVRACRKAGGYSDVGVYEWILGRWSRVQNTNLSRAI